MLNKPKGGRGIKAPYKTIVMRIPEPLVEEVENLINNYRQQLVDNGFIDNVKKLE